MKIFSIIGSGVVASIMMMATGCDSASGQHESPPKEQEQQAVAPLVPLVLDGIFLRDDGEDEIELRDAEHRYRLLVDGCSSEDCEEQGSFVLGVNELLLTVDGSGTRYSIPIEIEDAEQVEEEQQQQQTDDELPPSADVTLEQASNVRTLELVKPPNQLVKRNVRLVRQAKIRNAQYTKQAGSCSSTQIRQAQTYCRDVRCARQGQRSRGINYCAPNNGQISFSCACAGATAKTTTPLVNTTCGRCQMTYRRCRANQIACPKMADCLGDFYNCSDAISDCPTPRVQDFCTGWRP